ncbi:MAG: tyrosine-type recombinase/integrase, partial [Opitutaceae bacterium]
FYTGQRLGDIARLTWQNVDIERAQLRLVTGKTGRRIELPLAKPLLAHLTTLSASDDPKEPLFPNAFRVATGLRDRSSLSHGFYEILVSAGLASPRTKKSKGEDGKGRRRARVVNALSFHCLRHTATSLLKAAGVSETVAREIIGHDSAAVSRLYTHVSDASKREAVAKLPDVEGITSA